MAPQYQCNTWHEPKILNQNFQKKKIYIYIYIYISTWKLLEAKMHSICQLNVFFSGGGDCLVTQCILQVYWSLNTPLMTLCKFKHSIALENLLILSSWSLKWRLLQGSPTKQAINWLVHWVASFNYSHATPLGLILFEAPLFGFILWSK